jgi:nitrate reductase molybdenum cofactor assembly chaperone NarJ/NarW
VRHEGERISYEITKEARSDARETFREMKDMADPEDRRFLFKLFSVLLQYPDEVLVQSVLAGKDYLAHFSDGSWGAACREFLQHLETTPLISLQEDYVRTFDLRPSTCLNLTFHEFGDGKIRGAALAELNQLYKCAGYEFSVEDLPDFLPLVLEFLSVCSAETVRPILERYEKPIRGLAQRLHEEGSPYGDLLEALMQFIHEFKAAGE